MNKIIPVIMILLLVSTPSAFADRLLAINPDNQRSETPLFIKDTQTPSFTLEHVVRNGQNHFYSFNGEAGETISMKVNVPDIEPFRDFRPSFDLLIGNEKIIANPVMDRFHDRFTDTDWITTAELVVLLDQDGTYQIRVHDELTHYQFGNVGKFSFEIGFDKRFDIIDIVDLILAPFLYGHVKLFFGETMIVLIMLLLLFSAVMITWYFVSNRKKK